MARTRREIRIGAGTRRCEVPRAPHQGAGKAKRYCDALLIFPPAGSARAIAIHDWHRGAWAQDRSSNSRNLPLEPGAHAPGDIAAKRARARVHGVGPCLLEVLSAWHAVARNRACGRCRGLGGGRRAPAWCHPTHRRPDLRRGPASGPHRSRCPTRRTGFGSSSLVIPVGPITGICDVVRCVLYGCLSVDWLVSLSIGSRFGWQ